MPGLLTWRVSMHGRIVKFHETLKVGVIKTADGRKYRFARDQVINPNGRLVGYEVDFVKPVAGAPAGDVILLTGSIWSVFSEAPHGAQKPSVRRAS